MGTNLNTFTEQIKERSPRERAQIEEAEKRFDVIGQLILLRLDAGLTQTQLAQRSGINQSEISRIEGGRLNPTKETLESLARALGAHVAIVPDTELVGKLVGSK